MLPILGPRRRVLCRFRPGGKFHRGPKLLDLHRVRVSIGPVGIAEDRVTVEVEGLWATQPRNEALVASRPGLVAMLLTERVGLRPGVRANRSLVVVRSLALVSSQFSPAYLSFTFACTPGRPACVPAFAFRMHATRSAP